MPTVLDYLSAPEFTADNLTEAINVPPMVTGRPAQMGLFRDRPIATTYVKLGIREDEITLIPSRERGGEHNKAMRNGEGELLLGVPHFPLDDAITPMDLQNLLAFGEAQVFRTLAGVYNDKLASLRSKHDMTLSHLEWGALRGNVIDGEGKVLANLFTEFGVTQTVENFAFGTATTDVAARARAVKAAIRTALRGTPAGGVRILAGATWFDAFVGHTSVREAMQYYPAGGQLNPARDDVADVFPFAGVTVERIDEDYPFRQPDGTLAIQDAVPATEAIALPLGTDYFRRYIAPPDTIQDANRAPNPANRIFVSTDTRPHGKGQEIHTESNVLPICTRPQLLVRLTMT